MLPDLRSLLPRSVFLLIPISVTALSASSNASHNVAGATAALSIQVEVFSACGTGQFAASVGGVPIGTVPAGACGCEAVPLSVTSSDPAVLATITQPVCAPVSVTLGGSNAYVRWIRTQILTTAGPVDDCVYDSDGGTCSATDICAGGYVEAAPDTTWNMPIGDLDADDVNDCSDPDLDGDGVANGVDLCPLVADATNADGDGDGLGDVCDADLEVVAVPWLGDPTRPHEVYSGGTLHLQAVAATSFDEAVSLASATWDPGDGTGPVAVPVNNPWAIELRHAYTGTPGQRYTATVRVVDTQGAEATDTFEVEMRPRTLQVDVNMAIDNGLWFLHKQLARGDQAGVPTGWMPGAYSTAATAGAIHAMGVNNHRPSGNPREDPYVGSVQRMLRWLESQLQPIAIANKQVGNPDSNGNGIALYTSSGLANYTLGHVMSGFVASGVPDRVAVLGPSPGVRGRTYRDLMRDMADYYAYGQMDSSQPFPARGSWNYSHLPGHADISNSQWAAAGLHVAERFWGIALPPFVKNENWSSLGGLSATVANNMRQFGYLSPAPIWGALATTPSGAMQLQMNGERYALAGGSSPWLDQTMRWIAWNHRTANNYKCCAGWGVGNEVYAWYSTARVYRLMRNPAGQPAPVTLVDDDLTDGVPAWDWFWNDPPAGAPATAGPIGMARAFVSDQHPDGYWPSAGLPGVYLGTAYGVIILSPAHITPPPIAVCAVTPAVAGVGDVVTFSGASSNHPDTDRPIVKYDWDFGDGTQGTGVQATHTYAAAGALPHTFTATLTVTDDVGTTSQTTCASVQDILNEPPSASDNAYVTDEDTPLSGNVLTDGAPDADPEGSSLTAGLLTTPSAGTVALAPDGRFTYTPAADFHGTDTFTYRATDEAGATAAATVTIVVSPVNDDPQASANDYLTDEDTAVSGNVLTDGTADSDVDGDALTASLVTGPAHGLLVLNGDGTFQYTPTANFHGTDTATYRVSDGTGATATAAVTITVAPVNDAPVAVDLSYATTEGAAVSGTVLSGATDSDGDVLTAALATAPQRGTVVLNADGTFVYTAGVGFVGLDSFTYRVLDGSGASDVAAVTIDIAARNRPPVCTAARPSLDLLWPANGRLVAVEVLGVSDEDTDDVVTIRIDGIRQDEPTNSQGDGNTTIDADGVGTATPRVRAERAGTARAPGNGRVYHISFTAIDAAGASCSGTVLVGVPHDRGRRAVPIDDGPRFDSTAPGGAGGG